MTFETVYPNWNRRGSSDLAGVTVREFAQDGGLNKTVLIGDAVELTVGNTTGVSFGGVKLYTFPSGLIYVGGSSIVDLTYGFGNAGNATPIDSADGGDVSLGTTVAGDGTLSAADVNIMASTSVDPLSGGLTAGVATASVQDGTSTAVAAWLNQLIDDADVGDGASDVLEVDFVITLLWTQLGDT